MKLELFNEFEKYSFQYNFAIFTLLNNNPYVMDMIFPLTNLIHQKIENEIKFYISEPHINEKTFKELKINNTHKLIKLLERDELKKYYEGIETCEKYYREYIDSVIYFYEILGKESFLNSRYPIKTEQNNVTAKKEVDYDELYKKWTEYSEASINLSLMYVAYCSSNTIIYLKKEKKIKNELQENIYIEKIIEEFCGDLKSVDIKEEKNKIFILLKEFIKRNEYFDKRYIC